MHILADANKDPIEGGQVELQCNLLVGRIGNHCLANAGGDALHGCFVGVDGQDFGSLCHQLIAQ